MPACMRAHGFDMAKYQLEALSIEKRTKRLIGDTNRSSKLNYEALNIAGVLLVYRSLIGLNLERVRWNDVISLAHFHFY